MSFLISLASTPPQKILAYPLQDPQKLTLLLNKKGSLLPLEIKTIGQGVVALKEKGGTLGNTLSLVSITTKTFK